MITGTDTVSTFLEWSLFFLAKYPEVQEKAHKEIFDCFGLDHSISLQDTFRLPYLQALIEEIFRCSQQAALSVPRLTNKDVVLGGHLIPKGMWKINKQLIH